MNRPPPFGPTAFPLSLELALRAENVGSVGLMRVAASLLPEAPRDERRPKALSIEAEDALRSAARRHFRSIEGNGENADRLVSKLKGSKMATKRKKAKSVFTAEERAELREIVHEELRAAKFVVLYHGEHEPAYEVRVVEEQKKPTTLQEILKAGR